MIEAGHTRALDYGYSFYIAALNEHQIILGGHRKDMAIAARTARLANDRQWKQFIKRS